MTSREIVIFSMPPQRLGLHFLMTKTPILLTSKRKYFGLAQLERCNNKFENFGHYSLNIAKYKITRTLLLNFANENKQNISNHD